MEAPTALPIVDTSIIPDRNAGIGSLLLDLQDSRDPDRDEQPLLGPAFAFIDVGVSRAKVATTLKALLARELGMDVDYAATERLEAVPYANVVPLGEKGAEIRGCLSRMISSTGATREVRDWHCVVDRQGKVSSVAYSYELHGNEVWESYFMGRAFLVSGERVEFADPALDAMLAPDVREIEARIDRERRRDGDPGLPGPSWDGYRLEKAPLEAGLAECGIVLHRTDVPPRTGGRQNVLFLGNVLNQHPQDDRARELDRISANMKEGDIVVVQADEAEASSIEVLRVRGRPDRTTRERVRWIDTRTLEVLAPVRGTGSWRRTPVKPELERLVSGVIDCLRRKAGPPECGHEGHEVLVRRYLRHVFVTYFRASPVEEVLRVAVREALRRLPSGAVPTGIPVFTGDLQDAHGGALRSDPSPIVSEADLDRLGFGTRSRGDDRRAAGRRRELSSERSERRAPR